MAMQSQYNSSLKQNQQHMNFTIHSFRSFSRQLYYIAEKNRVIVGNEDGNTSCPDTLYDVVTHCDSNVHTSQICPTLIKLPAQSRIEQVSLHSIGLMLTRQCNMDCDYCCLFSGGRLKTKAPQTMPFGIAQRSIDILKAMGQRNMCWKIDLYGGEPFLHPDNIFNCMEYAANIMPEASKYRYYFSTTTNGTLLNKTLIERLSSYPIKIQISIDGSSDCHDRHRIFRGKKDTSHSDVVKNAVTLKELLGELNISSTWTPGDPTILERVAYFESLGATSIQISPVSPAQDPNKPTYLTHKHYDELLVQYEAYAKWVLAQYEEGKRVIFNPFLMVLGRATKEKGGGLCCKSQGIRQICIDTDGSVYPCYGFIGMPGHKLGTITEEKYRRSLYAWHKEQKEILSRCRGCWAWYLCGGGNICEHATPKGFQNNLRNKICYFNRGFIELCLGLLVQLWERKIEVFPLL